MSKSYVSVVVPKKIFNLPKPQNANENPQVISWKIKKSTIYEETTNIVIDDMADQTDAHMHFSSSLCKVRVKIQNKILIYTY